MSDDGACTRVAPDRGREIMSAALMALATVLSAWCGHLWITVALNAFGALLFVGTAVVAATFPAT